MLQQSSQKIPRLPQRFLGDMIEGQQQSDRAALMPDPKEWVAVLPADDFILEHFRLSPRAACAVHERSIHLARGGPIRLQSDRSRAAGERLLPLRVFPGLDQVQSPRFAYLSG